MCACNCIAITCKCNSCIHVIYKCIYRFKQAYQENKCEDSERGKTSFQMKRIVTGVLTYHNPLPGLPKWMIKPST